MTSRVVVTIKKVITRHDSFVYGKRCSLLSVESVVPDGRWRVHTERETPRGDVGVCARISSSISLKGRKC